MHGLKMIHTVKHLIGPHNKADGNAFNVRNEPISQWADMDIKTNIAGGALLEAMLWLP